MQYNGWRTVKLAVWIWCFFCACAGATSASSATITENDLRQKIEAATKDIKDISMTINVVEVDRKALETTDSNYARLMDLKSAKVAFKMPDKMRIEGKLGMVKFEYIINAGIKISRAPAIRFKRKDDYSKQPAKLQGPFDLGLVTASLWKDRKVEVLEDDYAAEHCEIKLKLKWPTGDNYYLAWIDANSFWLKRMEKRDEKDNLKVRMVYSMPKNIGGNVWIPTVAELYSGQSVKIGKTEITDIKYNVDLKDSLFQ